MSNCNELPVAKDGELKKGSLTNTLDTFSYTTFDIYSPLTEKALYEYLAFMGRLEFKKGRKRR
jgi:hypothetical protein